MQLPEHLDPKFEAFYRAELRGVRRHRVRSTALHERLVAWSDAQDVAALGFKGIRREMELIGHRRLLSNGVWFDDVAFAEDVPGVEDTLPPLIRSARRTPGRGGQAVYNPGEPANMLRRIDVALAELLSIRREVEAMQAGTDVHIAAEQILQAAAHE